MINVSKGDPVLFYKDAAAHFTDEGIPARVTAVHSGGTTVSLLTQEDPPVPYGPIAAPSFWTADPTEVGTTINPAGYYIQFPDTTQGLDAAAVAAAGAADSASAQAGLDQTPHQLINYVASAWSYDPTLEIWHARFANEKLSIYMPAPVQPTIYRLLFKDIPGGGCLFRVFESIRRAAPTVPTFSQIGGLVVSSGAGTIQDITIPVTSSATQARHRIDITSGPINGGVTIPNQYQLLQLTRDV